MSTLLEDAFSIQPLLSDEERGWAATARTFATERILPVIEQDFEDKHFRREFVGELGALGLLGMHLTDEGCAGAGAVSYGLVCLELEAADSGWRTFVSVQGSLAMSAISKFGSDEQKHEWLPPMARGERDRLLRAHGAGRWQRPVRDAHLRPPRRRRLGDRRQQTVDRTREHRRCRGRLGGDGRRACAGSWCRPRRPASRRRRSTASCRCGHRSSATWCSTMCGCPVIALLPGARGLSGPFSCLNEASYGIVWGAMGAARSRASRRRSDARRSREVFGKPIGATPAGAAETRQHVRRIREGRAARPPPRATQGARRADADPDQRRKAQQCARGAARSRARRAASSAATESRASSR